MARPGPPNGTGYHRYGQFLFEQPSANVTYAPVASSLAHFDYRAFIAEYRLGEKLGSNVMLVEDAGA
jgi:hypothetical protein